MIRKLLKLPDDSTETVGSALENTCPPSPSGYYMCAIAGGIDRVFRYGMGRKSIPDASDDLSNQMFAFCRLCGHFGFQRPKRRSRRSATWRLAYLR